MRVLFLDQFSDLGGAQHCLLDLVPAVLERGWEARVLLPGPGPCADRLAALGVPTSYFPCGPYTAGRKTIQDTARFGADVLRQIRIVRRYPADLVYVNGPRLLAASLFRPGPVLFHAHNYIDQPSAKRGARWIIRATGATVVACSRFVSDVAADKLHVIPNGTEDMGFRQRTFERDNLRIGIIGKLCRQKGQADFLRAAALITQALPRTRFVICGAGDENPLRKLASGLDVTFLGWRDDIASVFARLDLLVIASEQEGQSRVMLEAFSAGVPVVAYPVGGIREVIQDGETGFFVPQCTPEALASRICSLGTELPAIAAAARKLWEQRFTLSQYRSRVLEAMSQAAGHPAESAATPQRQRTVELPLSASADTRSE